MLVTRPSCTVTSRLHESGQSSGQTVATVCSAERLLRISWAWFSLTQWNGRSCAHPGGGFGGLEAARSCVGSPSGNVARSSQLPPVSAAPLSGRDGHAFSGDIASPIRWISDDRPTCACCLARPSRSTRLAHGPADGRFSLDYDFLIVATGASHTYFGHDDWGRHAPGLKRWKMRFTFVAGSCSRSSAPSARRTAHGDRNC